MRALTLPPRDLEDTLCFLHERLGDAVIASAVGDLDSGAAVALCAVMPEEREMLLRTVEFVACQLREQIRFLREFTPDEDLRRFQQISASRVLLATVCEDVEAGGLFVLLTLDRSRANIALAEHVLRGVLAGLSLGDDDKSRVNRLRREAWCEGTSGLLVRMRATAPQPAPGKVEPFDAPDDELPAFLREGSAERLLGIA